MEIKVTYILQFAPVTNVMGIFIIYYSYEYFMHMNLMNPHDNSLRFMLLLLYL